jgi:alginate O-acetyltransferase complex protein AlgI
LFSSLDFAVFFAIVLAVYPLLGRRAQNGYLLVLSYVFYGWWDWRYLGLILASSTVDFLASRGIVTSSSDAAKKRWLVASLLFNLGVLGFFKYFGFFVESAGDALTAVGFDPHLPVLQIVLPVGISFFTFQSMSYTLDVYLGRTKPTDRYFEYLLFVAFFPQLVAGPIERSSHLLGQIQRDRVMRPQAVWLGLMLIVWGLFKKVVVADNLAIYVDAVYGNVDEHGGLSLLLSTWLFAFQIYCDFSGYSDMAIGIAGILGFDLMTNFRTPYFAADIQEFWRRWHISLSTWFRDYLYVPLGGNRVPLPRRLLNTMIVFVVSGFWHGANWTFVIWGALHGLYLAVRQLRIELLPGAAAAPRGAAGLVDRPAPSLASRAAGVFVTFQLVCLGWVFFRAKSVGEAWEVLATIATTPGTLFVDPALANGLFALVLLLGVELMMGYRRFDEWLAERAAAVQIGVLTLLCVTVTAFAVQAGTRFIYFAF